MESGPEFTAERKEDVAVLVSGGDRADLEWLGAELGRSRTRRFVLNEWIAGDPGGRPHADVVVVLHRGDAVGADLLHCLGLRIPVVVVGTSDDERFAARLIEAGARSILHRDEVNTRLLVTSLLAAIEGQRASDRHGRGPGHPLATSDLLTGLANRYLFEDRVSQALAAGRRSGWQGRATEARSR